MHCGPGVGFIINGFGYFLTFAAADKSWMSIRVSWLEF